MALLIGSILMLSLHALVVSSARMMRRTEEVQRVTRADLAIQRQLRRDPCLRELPEFPTQKGLRVTRDDRGAVVVERREAAGWRRVAVSAPRCDLPEVCEWDVTARACREGARP